MLKQLSTKATTLWSHDTRSSLQTELNEKIESEVDQTHPDMYELQPFWYKHLSAFEVPAHREA